MAGRSRFIFEAKDVLLKRLPDGRIALTFVSGSDNMDVTAQLGSDVFERLQAITARRPDDGIVPAAARAAVARARHARASS